MNLLQTPFELFIQRKQLRILEESKTVDQKIPFKIVSFINQHFNLPKFQTQIIPKNHAPNKTVDYRQNLECIVSLKSLNNIRDINHYLNESNEHLSQDGYLIGCLETTQIRETRFRLESRWRINKIIFFLDYMINRVIPKLPFFGPLYFFLTRGRNQIISETEMIGRLIVSGFDLVDTMIYQDQLYFIGKKARKPDKDFVTKCGVLINLPRIGKDGKILKMYKLRTMFPYSEILQNYVHKVQGLESGGKIKDDPRISRAGHFFRKYWLDEVPMIINLLKGDIKIFGVRPISNYYLSLYPEKFQEYRKQFKPGLIPPLYVEIADTFDDIVAIENRYLKSYEANPITTDIRYFFKFLHNVFLKGVRSM